MMIASFRKTNPQPYIHAFKTPLGWQSIIVRVAGKEKRILWGCTSLQETQAKAIEIAKERLAKGFK